MLTGRPGEVLAVLGLDTADILKAIYHSLGILVAPTFAAGVIDPAGQAARLH